MALTEHQELKLNEGIVILETSNRLLVKGSAGVGKTFLANELIKRLRSIYGQGYKRAICSAPTNKAVAVIKDKVTPHQDLDFATVHKTMKMKRNIDNKTGDVSFEPWFNEKYPPLKGIYLMVIDEASMLNKALMEYIEIYADRFNVKVVFLGDEKQLNPVGETSSMVFESNYPEIELTEIIRQGEGNPIIDLSRNIGNIWGKTEKINMGFDGKRLGFTYSYDRDKIISRLADVNGTDEMKYLAWTNRQVDNLNFHVRQKIYGEPNKIELGETLVFNSPYGDDFFTNEEILVDDLNIIKKKIDVITHNNPITGEFQSKEVEISMYMINDSVKVIHEESDKLFTIILKDLKSNCFKKVLDWKTYFKFVESFGDMKYNHAITVHKSQGSTYKDTIIDVKNMALNSNPTEKQRLFYTGITRASDLLILYNV